MEAPDLSAMDPAERLEADPNGFGFFQAVRLLERAHPDKAPVGGFADPADEVARFSVPPSLAFPASEIQALDATGDGPAKMLVNFFGLTGPLGVLPYHYTQLVAQRAQAKDPVMRDFFDLFHHRLISLFYRAWEKYRFSVAFERDQQDRLSAHVADLIGLAPERANAKPSPVRREALLFYAGLIASRQRSAQSLESMLRDYFGVPVTVEQFVGAWYPLGDEVLTRLDDDEAAGTAGLGEGCPVGDEIWDQQASVRLRIGPLSRAQYEQFLPRGSAYQALKELTHMFGGDGFDFEVQLVLDRRDVPAAVLGAERGEGLPLSWGTWIRTTPFDRDPDDTILIL